MRCLLIATLCVSQTTGFAGLGDLPSLHDAVSPFLQHSTAIATSAVSTPFAAELLEKYKYSLAVHPLETKMITGAVLATMGDAIAQSREPEEYDKRRAASFMAFDSAYRALQHNVYPWIVQQCQGQFFLGAIATIPPLAKFVSETMDPSYFAAMEQTLASQLGVVPFMYYPVFFAFTGAIQGLSVERAINRAKENIIPLMKRNLIFWIPVQFIQFGFVEEGLQIPFLCVCGLAWTSILSIMAGSTKSYVSGSTKEYKYCVTGMENECVVPDELFPGPVGEMIREFIGILLQC